MSKVRVRFCPSPTGNPHVGLVRTALFNWAFARHHDGVLVLRIEDTDVERNSEASYNQLLDSLRWLGLTWDEGPEVGGDFGPYRQSERMDIYTDVADQLFAGRYAYRCYCTPDEVTARYEAAKDVAKAKAAAAKEAAKADGAADPNAAYKEVWSREQPVPGYDGHCRDLAGKELPADFAERPFILRFRMPDGEISWRDLVRGELSFASTHVPDFGLVRANGRPLYTLVNPVDDALMGITHVLRGEDLLSSTPRQIALYAALQELGIITTPTPEFGHLPYVMGTGNKKLSKRDKGASLQLYRDGGYLPEGLLNYLALLGWSPGGDREFFSLLEMASLFDIDQVKANPASFDLQKCTAINADWIRHLATEELVDRLLPVLQKSGLINDPASEDELARLSAVTPHIQERMQTLNEAVDLVRFLFVPEDEFECPADLAAATFTPDNRPALVAALARLSELRDTGQWQTDPIASGLRAVLIDEMGLKPRHAFGPVRTAISGAKISPPLFESLEILGPDIAIARIQTALNQCGSGEVS